MKKNKSGIVVVVFLIISVIAVIVTVVVRNQLNRKEGIQLEVGEFASRGVTEAYRINDENGELSAYDIYVTVNGYLAPIETRIRIDGAGEKLMNVEIIAQDETAELGGKITESFFLNQFNGIGLPVVLDKDAGTKAQEETADGGQNTEENDAVQGNLAEAVKRADGVYHSVSEEADGGYFNEVRLVIKNGEITEVFWDSVDADGNSKRVLSLNGSYVMTEDGLLWAEQADALQDYVVEHQSLGGLNPDAAGKTDAVAGVSISITGFTELVNECLAKAAGMETVTNPEDSPAAEDNKAEKGANIVDAVSGATVSSRAVVSAINTAYEYVLGH